MNKGGFSWKRLTGVTRVKSSISRAIGVPLTRSGRQRKIGRIVTGGGCLLPVLLAFGVLAVLVGAGCAPGVPARPEARTPTKGTSSAPARMAPVAVAVPRVQ